VGTRITLWVSKNKIQLGFLVELKNFPAQDYRKNCDLNKDMEIDEKEREHYIKECCKKFIENLHVKINGEELAKTITKTDLYGLVGDVSRDPFSTYIEAQATLDKTLYKVKIEYANDNFRNEEPQIINDVNLSISKRLDNINIYPIIPIVQYLDRELADHLFMEMTLDRHFFIEFGCKDVGVTPEPFTANEVMLTKDSTQTSRQAKSGTRAPGISSSTWDTKLYKWLDDFMMTRVEGAIKADDIVTWLWLFVFGVFVGLVHVMLPGHGKGVVLSYVGATNAKPLDAVKLSLMITVVHTLSTVVLAACILALAGRYLSGTIKNVGITYLSLISGGLIVVIGVYLFFFLKPVKLRREEEKEREIVDKALESAGAGRSSFSLKLKVAIATGIIPCITSSAAAVLCFNYEEYLKAFLLIGFIAVGQAITLSLMGAAASGGMLLLGKGAAGKQKGFFVGLLKLMPKITAVILVIVGIYAINLGWKWKKALGAVAQPKTAEERIEAYEQIVKEKPENSEAQFNLALLYAAKDKLDKSVSHFRKALDTQPDNLDCLRLLAHALSRLEEYDEALELYLKALKKLPGDANLLFNVAYVNRKLGNEKETLGRYLEAAQAGEPRAAFNAGIICENQSRLDKALEYYMQAADSRPEDMNILMAVATVYRKRKEYGKAIEALLQIREGNPASRDVNLALANIYLQRLEQEDKAQPYLKAYLENGGEEEISAAIGKLKKQEVATTDYLKWEPPPVAEKFAKFGACAFPRLEKLAREQNGELLKSTLAAIAATEAPQAIDCILEILCDAKRWTEDDFYENYGPDTDPVPVPVIAKEAFLKCMRKSAVPLVTGKLIEVMDEASQREYFLKLLLMDFCAEHPYEFMDAVLAYAKTAEEDNLRRAVELAISLKGEVLNIAEDQETLKVFVSYVHKWWEENRAELEWDGGNRCFKKKE
jgi:tetratricopeptide (TPR) repeat protein